MPRRPLHACKAPRCPNLTSGRYCDDHAVLDRRADDRPSASERGYDRDWQALRAAHLRDHPLCEPHGRQGRVCADRLVVDHKIPHRGDRRLLLDPDNLETMCKPLHDAKTAREDGGFGNRRVEADLRGLTSVR